jgi:hypothetical protein
MTLSGRAPPQDQSSPQNRCVFKKRAADLGEINQAELACARNWISGGRRKDHHEQTRRE